MYHPQEDLVCMCLRDVLPPPKSKDSLQTFWGSRWLIRAALGLRLRKSEAATVSFRPSFSKFLQPMRLAWRCKVSDSKKSWPDRHEYLRGFWNYRLGSGVAVRRQSSTITEPFWVASEIFIGSRSSASTRQPPSDVARVLCVPTQWVITILPC